MNNKKIWLINHYATRMFIDKSGRHFCFAKHLTNNGYDPLIICADKLHENGKKVHYVYTTEPPFFFIKTISATKNNAKRLLNIFLFYLNLLLSTNKIIKIHGKPDIILASSVHPLTLVAGLKIAQKLKIPCLCEVRDLWPEVIFTHFPKLEKNILGKLMLKGEYWIYKKADALIFTKEGDIDYLKEKKWNLENEGKVDLKKVFYINNGCDFEQNFSPIKTDCLPPLQSEEQTFNVVYTGSIRMINDLDKIVDTAYLLKDYKDIKFFIYGEGNQRERLEKKVLALNLSNIHFKGYVNKQCIPDILKHASLCLLHYKHSEYYKKRGDSSNKLFDYLAARKPVISTVKVAHSIILKYNCGIELDNPNPDVLAENILIFKNMCKNKYDTYAQNAFLAAKQFDYKILTEKLIEIIASLSHRC